VFIKLYVSQAIFHMFRVEDILSIEPCFFDHGVFEKYLVYLSGKEEPIELTFRQGTNLSCCVRYSTVSHDSHAFREESMNKGAK
jgi:hypothetical protein